MNIQHEDHILCFWECPKCGVVNWQDVKVIKEDDKYRLKHKCGNLLKPSRGGQQKQSTPTCDYPSFSSRTFIHTDL